MKILVFAILLSPLACFSQSQYVNAHPIDNPNGEACKVLVAEYHAGAKVSYLGQCGWKGLKNTAAYISKWNHSNHIQIVRGNFSSGEADPPTKVTYINVIRRTITTYEETYPVKRNMRRYRLDDVVSEAKQASIQIDDGDIGYIKLANYVDIFE